MRKDLKLIGAAEERRAVLRKVRREAKWRNELPESQFDYFVEGARDAYNTMETWLLDRDKRYNKRKGGLGR